MFNDHDEFVVYPADFDLVPWTFQLSACERNWDQVKIYNNGWPWTDLGQETNNQVGTLLKRLSVTNKKQQNYVLSVFHKLLFFSKYFTAVKAKTVHTKVWELSRRCMWIFIWSNNCIHHLQHNIVFRSSAALIHVSKARIPAETIWNSEVACEKKICAKYV